MKDWFKAFFSEEDGPSTTRALNWIWMITFCSILLFVVIYNTFKTGEAKFPAIDNSYVLITSSLLAAKVGQRVWGENPQTPPAP